MCISQYIKSCDHLKIKIMGKSLQFATYMSDLFPSAPTLAQLPRPTAQTFLVFYYYCYTLKLLSPQEVYSENFKPSIRALVV